MPAPIARHASYLRLLQGPDQIILAIDIGNAQFGQWRVMDSSGVIDSGDTNANSLPHTVALGTGASRKGQLVVVEVICQDQQPVHDFLNAAVAVTGITDPVNWTPNNAGEESPQCVMTCVCDLYFL